MKWWCEHHIERYHIREDDLNFMIFLGNCLFRLTLNCNEWHFCCLKLASVVLHWIYTVNITNMS